MTAKKTTRRNRSAEAEGPAASEVVIDVCGVSMLLPESKKVLLIDGRQPRRAMNSPDLIPAHVPFIGFRPGSFKVISQKPDSPPATPKLTFDFEIDGVKAPFRAFLFDGHRVCVEKVKNNEPKFTGKRYASMKQLAPTLELCTGVDLGTSRQVIGTLECRNAVEIKGKPHHKDEGLVTLRNEKMDCADMLAATFATKRGIRPQILMKNATQQLTIELQGEGPWHLIVGNVPFEELVATHVMAEGHDLPLSHIEIVYDLYHVSSGVKLEVPRVDNHQHAQTINGRCGPTVVPDASPTPAT